MVLMQSCPGPLGHVIGVDAVMPWSTGSMVLTPTMCAAIRLTSCPSLRTPPNEVVSRGVESVKAYLKRLAGGFTECRRTKLMFVGLGGAGKTRWGLV